MSKVRDNRNLKNGHFYHIYNIGNRNDPIALNTTDLAHYRRALLTSFRKYRESILAYCLLNNRFHLLIKVNKKEAFIKAISLFQYRCAIHYNNNYSTVGHLFKDKYGHKLIKSPGELIQISRHIHLSPFIGNTNNVAFGLLKYDYSSMKAYLGIERTSLIERNYILRHFRSSFAYYAFILSGAIGQQVACLKSNAFEEYIEELLKKQHDF